MTRQTAPILLHLLLIAGIVALMVLCMVYPFLPGDYDMLAVPLSIMMQTAGVSGLVLVPIGVLWLAYELWRRARKDKEATVKPRRFSFAFAALIAASLVALAAAFAAGASAGISLGLFVIAFWLYVIACLLSLLKRMKTQERSDFNFIPLYLTFTPLAALGFQLMLAIPVTQGSRDHAISMSAEIISAIEAYRAANGSYPESLFATYPDYSLNVTGIEQYHYARQGDTYNLSFHQPRFLLDDIGVREFVVYNPRDEHSLISHASWILLLSPTELQRSQGWFAVRDAGSAHWKYFWFD